MTKMVRGKDCQGDLLATTSNTPTGAQTPADPSVLFFIDNWVSPMLPTPVVS